MLNPDLNTFMADHDITIAFNFVPWSKSRYKREATPSFNYKATLFIKGEEILTTDYMMGIAHSPSYTAAMNMKTPQSCFARECECGRTDSGVFIMPSASDVFSCLIRDIDVLDYPTFEEWADEFGFDQDSRMAEALHKKATVDSRLLRNAIGEELLAEALCVIQDD